jgi:hypothetical protein
MNQTEPAEHTRLLTVKELAYAMKRTPGYVYAARARGFKMPGGVSTVIEFRQWLAIHPNPRSRTIAGYSV